MERSVLEVLLAHDIPEPETQEIKIERLSQMFGEEVIFKIRELDYDTVADLKRREHMDLHIILNGVVSPDLRDKTLRKKIGGETPFDMLKKLLKAGEIEELSRKIELLSGYRQKTMAVVNDVKKKSAAETTKLP